jgi:RNA polymerase sigma-70 factor (ECF subfamily)
VTLAPEADMTTEATIGDLWQAHHAYLVNVAARALGTRVDAEDVVQDAFGRLAAVPLDEIDDVRGWLTVVVRRLSLNRLRSAYRRREEATGDAGEGDGDSDGAVALDGRDPVERVTLDEQVQDALAVVLDRLTPAERTSFVLHDVFGFPFDAVAAIVGRTPAACRQLASRGRRAVRIDDGAGAGAGAPPPPRASAPDGRSARHRRLAERFTAACAGGDLGELMAVLDPDVVGDARMIGGGPVGGLLNHAEGADAVAHRILALFGPDSRTTLIPLDLEDTAGVVALGRGRFVSVFRLDAHADTDTDTDASRIHHIHAFVFRP